MKRCKQVFLFCVTLLVASASYGQMIADPTTWTYEVKKKSATDYQVIFHLSLKSGWHIWSLHPGGDGSLIAPSFEMKDGVVLKGEPMEKGKAITTTSVGIDGKVTYLAGKVDYVVNVTAKNKKKITGQYTYQVCNEQTCLPPKTKDFTVDIK